MMFVPHSIHIYGPDRKHRYGPQRRVMRMTLLFKYLLLLPKENNKTIEGRNSWRDVRGVLSVDLKLWPYVIRFRKAGEVVTSDL
jgi:hypothetical protein